MAHRAATRIDDCSDAVRQKYEDVADRVAKASPDCFTSSGTATEGVGASVEGACAVGSLV